MSKVASASEFRSVPTYDFSEAAHYLHLPESTVRSWVRGQDGFAPLITPAGKQSPMLSFLNLVEIHILAAIRRVRSPEHPLLGKIILTDGVDLFAREYGELVNLSKRDQKMMVEVISAYLKRIEWEDNKPAILFPFGSANVLEGRRSVMIDPRVAFGRLVLAGTGIPVEIIIERFNAGESIDDIATDYRRDRLEIEDALRLESTRAA